MEQIWELDFYSRPVVDENNKKRWELLVCESPLTLKDQARFSYSQWCSSTEVNSDWLRQALETAIAEAEIKPDKVRFFRQPMTNMILKACRDLGLNAQLSRRTFALQQWINDRLASVYPLEEGYQSTVIPALNPPATNPQPLPDALRGQKWGFAALSVQELEALTETETAFGEVFPPKLVGLENTTQVPGLVIFSDRAVPLAAWMSGLELAALKLNLQPTPALGKMAAQRLILETGGYDRWILATFRDPKTLAEAQSFEAAKKEAQMVHFLAVQSNANNAEVTGFWLLQDLDLG